VTELTIGYMANSQDAVFMAIRCTEDHDGNPIYNRQDFIDRADADPYFVTEFIGAGDSMTFSHGSKVMLDGVTFYRYPAELSLSLDTYNGAILVGNAPDTGCYLLYYGVREGCASYDATLSLLESCMDTFWEK